MSVYNPRMWPLKKDFSESKEEISLWSSPSSPSVQALVEFLFLHAKILFANENFELPLSNEAAGFLFYLCTPRPIGLCRVALKTFLLESNRRDVAMLIHVHETLTHGNSDLYNMYHYRFYSMWQLDRLSEASNQDMRGLQAQMTSADLMQIRWRTLCCWHCVVTLLKPPISPTEGSHMDSHHEHLERPKSLAHRTCSPWTCEQE